MKMYENAEAGRRLMPLLPALARIDGRSFSNFTNGMDKPYDTRMLSCMVDTATELAKHTNACMAYTQSDEITLAWHSTNIKSQIWFDGRVAKMTSQLAAQASVVFYRFILERMPEYAERIPTFDARVWNVPNRTEGSNSFLWRELDATRNSLNSLASFYYSHSELMNKNSSQRHDMLMHKGINWNDYPPEYKRGVYIQRKLTEYDFDPSSLTKSAREVFNSKYLKPGGRSSIKLEKYIKLDLPPIKSIVNREDVIFSGSSPILISEIENASL